jgi:hypothetical protein
MTLTQKIGAGLVLLSVLTIYFIGWRECRRWFR